ncbi:SDR family oxidoreductase [Chloroflexi bacterium]|nr:SDR family oxidoreductase [Chloroflexota bacterium]
MNILIAGATGYVGTLLIKKLSSENHNIVCISRNPEMIESRFPQLNLKTHEGDLLSLKENHIAFNNIDVAYYLVHSLSAGKDFPHQELKCAENFIKAAKSARIPKVIYLGGLANEQSELSKHLKSRLEVGAMLRSTEVVCVELQASVIIGSGSLSYEIMKNLVERLPVMLTPKWVSSMSQPIWIEDALEYLTQSATVEFNKSEVIQIGGPNQITYKQLMQIYANLKNLKRLMISVPVLTPNLSSKWLGLVTPVYARVGKKLIESLKNDSVVTNPVNGKLFNITPSSVETAIVNTMKSEHDGPSESRWYNSISSSAKIVEEKDKKSYRYLLRDVREITVGAEPVEAFKPINQIGGPNGWYYANFLWKIRGWIDLLSGGVGIRRTRGNQDTYIIGDTLDWWRVSDHIPNKLVILDAEMKLPGKAWLKFEIVPSQKGSLIRQTAGMDTNKLLGLLYWYGLFPLHSIIFRGMLNAIGKRVSP